MKAILLLIGFVSLLIAARSKQAINQAEVNQVQGINIFTDCKPLQSYQYLGSVKAFRVAGSSQYEPIRDFLIKKIKKEFPAANGAVLHLNSGRTDYADAINLQE